MNGDENRSTTASLPATGDADPALLAFIDEELSRSVLPEAAAFAADIAARPGVAAVLFYGSCLQRQTTEGMLDFYALTDAPGAYGQSFLIERAGRALPPNVYPEAFGGMKAKVAVVSIAGFNARMRAGALDTTFWARFCQRAALVTARDEASRRAAIRAVATAVETAAIWASRLSPEAEGVDAWRGLFAKTYKVEIRVESPDRAADIVGADEARFVRLWALTARARAAAKPPAPFAWPARWTFGKIFHVSRLLKAAFTFEGGLRYLIWKIRRHRKR